MEALSVSSSISKLSAVARGVNGTLTPSSSSPLKFCHHATGHRKQRKLSPVAAATSADNGGGAASGTGEEDMAQSRRGKVLLASLASALANVGILSSSALAAVDYDEIVGNVKQAASSSSEAFSVPDVDASGLLDTIGSNPLLLFAGGAVLALPLIVSTVFKSPEGYGTVSAKQAYEKLGDEALGAQLLDIRVPQDIVFEGTPNLKDYRKKATQVPCTEVSEEYIDKVLAKFKFKDPENATIYIVDRFDGNSLEIAKALAKSGIKAFAVKGGTEGPGGWQASELPWLEPSKGFSLNLGELLPKSPDAGGVGAATLGVAAAAGVGLVVFSEAETVLQLLGSAVLLQVFTKKFLFAKDRKKTYEEIQYFLDTKIVPKGLVDELKGIAGTVLPKVEEAKVATTNGTATFEDSVATADAKISEAGAGISQKTAEISEAVKTEDPSAKLSEAGAGISEKAAEVSEAVKTEDPSAKLSEAGAGVSEKAAEISEGVKTEDPSAKISEAGAGISEKTADVSEAVKSKEPPPATEPKTERPTTVAEIPPPPPPPSSPAEKSPAPVESTPVAEAPAPPSPSEPKSEEGSPGAELYPGLKPPTSPSPSRP